MPCSVRQARSAGRRSTSSPRTPSSSSARSSPARRLSTRSRPSTASSTCRWAVIRRSSWSEAPLMWCSTPSSASRASARRSGRSSTASPSRSRTRRASSPQASWRVRARERGGGTIVPVDSEHSALHQCLEGREPETVLGLVLTASGGPFRGRSRAELEGVTPEEALAHPTWRMGPEDHDRLGDAREQGSRADRGPLALRRPRRPDRGRGASDLRRPLARSLPRRGAARASRPARHARSDLVRAHLPGARGDRRRPASARGPRPLVRARRRRGLSAARRGPRTRPSAAGPRHVPTTQPTRWPSRRSSTDASASRRSRRSWRRRSSASTPRPRATSTTSSPPTREARSLASERFSRHDDRALHPRARLR